MVYDEKSVKELATYIADSFANSGYADIAVDLRDKEHILIHAINEFFIETALVLEMSEEEFEQMVRRKGGT